MFRSLFRADGVDDRSPWGSFWFEPVSLRSSAGVRVSADAAMRLSAVYACVRVLAETMASLPLKLYRARGDGGKDVVTDHWLYPLLARQPNRWQNAFEWREMMQGHLALRGNAYNRIVPGARGAIAELQPLSPDRITIEVLKSGTWRYRYRHADGSDEVLAPPQVFHLRGLSADGLKGLSPIECARESVGIGLAAQSFGARFFANDARPLGGWIEYPGAFKDKAARDVFREQWQQGQTGENRGKIAVLESGMQFHEVGLNNKDSQFLESRQFQIADIARWFRVPPHLIGDLSKATFSNIEQQSLEFVTFTMTPWAERWEAAIEAALLPEEDELEIEFDFANLLRGDQQARGEFYNLGITNGWLTRNEARLREGLDPIPGLEKPLEPLNMAPAGSRAQPGGSGGQAPPADEEPNDSARRLDALVRAIADRAVHREVVWLRRALAGGEWDAPRIASWYAEHCGYLEQRLQCGRALAEAWCTERAAELEGSPERETTLKEWDRAGGAELAARAQTSAHGKESA